MVHVPLILDGNGGLTVTFALPDHPLAYVGDLFLQWVYGDSARLRWTAGMHARIRP